MMMMRKQYYIEKNMKRLNSVGGLVGRRSEKILIDFNSSNNIGHWSFMNVHHHLKGRTFSTLSFHHQEEGSGTTISHPMSNITNNQRTTVVLCHGCFGFASQFFFIEKKLIESGKFRVLNYWYPSYRQSIERSSSGLYDFLNEHRQSRDHVLSRSASVWYSNYVKEQQQQETSDEISNEDESFHFVTHSMGSMIVRNFLVNNVQNNLDINDGNICDNLLKQDALKLIQISPLLSGRVKLARDLKFLHPMAKVLRSYPEEPTIVEQFMNHVESDGWDEVFAKSFWWAQDSVLSNKVRMTNIVTSMTEFQQNEPSLFSDLVLTVDEQTASIPLHLKDSPHTELVYVKGDHASILNRDVCIDKVLQVLSS
ncbi:hypothetical protein NAEGRDRAFT_81271 [Naegleria gruberi]|uniref:Uncharacterized protein n=1 Tax=Naegleria gruberi TaxID=5762 RepID=D2VUH0_NAEGR|nr:uncharacterized protein NAEGRDRAFT_81271 [Naegleria gruberi]EFC39510.1 hypothetical protein NAEGRDRAFT_81271 [Naegleria gruberi]|eukprot:XP_002672254.1 hypothetical protein NAEGRDRAFT_81271 [Naegleria gruberi strain NEG-M]